MGKYEDAFRRAKAAYGSGAYDDETMEFLFPDLKNTDDSVIGEWLKKYIESMMWKKDCPVSKQEVLDWIERHSYIQSESADDF